MRKSPLNYLVTFAIAGVLWIITAVLTGNSLGESISLATMSIEDFLIRYRIVLAVAAVLGLLNSFCWYFYGSKDSIGRELNRARKIWNISFIVQIVVAAGLVVALAVMLMAEGVSPKDYLIIFGLASLHTFILFWFCTLLMSPNNVKNLVPFMW
jgi:hypothetical protein